jgi:hypothetical protein
MTPRTTGLKAISAHGPPAAHCTATPRATKRSCGDDRLRRAATATPGISGLQHHRNRGDGQQERDQPGEDRRLG